MKIPQHFALLKTYLQVQARSLEYWCCGVIVHHYVDGEQQLEWSDTGQERTSVLFLGGCS